MISSARLIHRINTFRNLPTGTGIQKAYTANLKKQSCLIQPLSAEYANRINEVFGRAYNLFLPIDADVAIGDKITDQNNFEYRVTGNATRDYGVNAHKTLIITQQVQSVPDR